jgi:hypothetical protein
MFPVYLKYKQHATYFFNLTKHQAKILPDRLFIADLLEDKGERLEKITQHEFDDMLEFCYRNKIEKVF